MAQEPTQSSLVQGTLDMIILRTLALEPMHGYGIGVRIEQISRGVFQVNAGSLFPALRRLERDGLIKGEWAATERAFGAWRRCFRPPRCKPASSICCATVWSS